MAEQSTNTGINRTGVQTSPIHAKELQEISRNQPSMPAEDLEMSTLRQHYAKDTEGLGSVPPPGSMKGMATTAMEMIQGHKPTVFIDKLGERLAFERGGVRLYDAMLAKFDALGTWEGGPSRQEIMDLRDDELQHFQFLKECIERMGADPTAMTPSADLTGVEVLGINKIFTDARTTLPQVMHAAIIVEASDLEGWQTLIQLADSIGQNGLADEFRKAQATEEKHHERVRRWLNASVLADAKHELGNQGRS